VPDDLKGYVTADIEAAVARIDKALIGAKVKGGLPTLEIAVQPWLLEDDELAAANPAFTKKVSGLNDDIKRTDAETITLALPLASYEKLTGTDLNRDGPDLKIFVDPRKLEQIYSGGKSSEDGTSLMLHEVMHGLGVGVAGHAGSYTPWGITRCNGRAGSSSGAQTPAKPRKPR
jgi:hypothetical protein